MGVTSYFVCRIMTVLQLWSYRMSKKKAPIGTPRQLQGEWIIHEEIELMPDEMPYDALFRGLREGKVEWIPPTEQ